MLFKMNEKENTNESNVIEFNGNYIFLRRHKATPDDDECFLLLAQKEGTSSFYRPNDETFVFESVSEANNWLSKNG